MRSNYKLILFPIIILVILANSLLGKEKAFELKNDNIKLSIKFEDGILKTEELELADDKSDFKLKMDGNFGFDIVYTSWRAPKKINNSANPLELNKFDFTFVDSHNSSENGNKKLDIFLHGNNSDFDVKLTYKLMKDKNYFKRSISIRDTLENVHFLRKIKARKGEITQGYDLVKAGSYGQPAAFTYGDKSVFFGLEFPTSTNTIKNGQINSFQYIGKKIMDEWISSEKVVFALYPDNNIKHHFFEYLADIRVHPLEPYTLYNSWYDLRSEIYTEALSDNLKKYGFDPENVVMDEENVKDIIESIRTNFTEKNDIKLDAFVLDDGWDVYESPWKLREKEFSNGMKPIADELAKDNADLGIWFGPTGGYSYRMKRINWMDEQGYETVGEEVRYNSAMLCLAGEKYSDLFKKRVKDFVKEDNVGFFKWDGIQFVCNEPDHGHPVGIYSREAVMNATIEICNTVRKHNPDTYLNITSGTWLSPWWVKYANQIWMGGRDYGWAPTPSISKRDASITYRDNVLYSDFIEKDFWFPISNLMTHGIIKGNLQLLGGAEEPLDKFTDNALLYFARGVSMWELYISPNILSEGEWNAMSQSIKWAEDRFEILKTTNMVGGDPLKGEPYGYAHYKDKKGIIAVRNPFITNNKIKVDLSEKLGMSPEAKSLVLERVYPTRWISPELYSAGGNVEIDLNGYETAIYEVYPVEEAQIPLVSGLVFGKDEPASFSIYQKAGDVKLLNPGQVRELTIDNSAISISEIDEYNFPAEQQELKKDVEIKNHRWSKTISANIDLEIQENVASSKLAVLLEPEKASFGNPSPNVEIELNDKSQQPEVQGEDSAWHWYKTRLTESENEIRVQIKPGDKKEWNGRLSIYVINEVKHESVNLNYTMDENVEERPMPPSPWMDGITKQIHELKKQNITL